MMHLKLVLSLILSGIIVVFVVQNVTVVEISFLFWSFAMSRALLIFFVMAAGIIIGWLLHGYYSYHRNPSGAEIE